MCNTFLGVLSLREASIFSNEKFQMDVPLEPLHPPPSNSPKKRHNQLSFLYPTKISDRTLSLNHLGYIHIVYILTLN